MQHRSHRFTVALVLTAAALAACDNDNDSTSPQNSAMVRVVNASSSNSSINSTIGSTSVASGLSFQNSNAAASCVAVPAGTQSINFTSNTGAAIGSASSYNFQAGQRYTVVLFGNGTSAVYPESWSAPTSGNSALRFINATGTAGDVYGTTASGTVSGSPAVSALAAYSATGGTTGAGAFSNWVSSNTRWRMYNVGSTSTPRADYTISGLPSNNVGTVVFTNAATTGGPTGFLVSPCT